MLNNQETSQLGRFQAAVHVGSLLLHQKPEQADGVSFVLTPRETTQLLELLERNRSSISDGVAVADEVPGQDSFDELLASFAYQRAL